jgi:peptide/nickel transport system substrate-binding protein
MPLRRAAIAVLAITWLLAACTGEGGRNGDATPQPVPTVTEPPGAEARVKDAQAQGPATVPAEAVAGGVLTVSTSRVPVTLDPTRAYYSETTSILNLVTRALTQYQYDPHTNEMVLVPDMATDLGRPNDDYTEWTFTLKDGLKYEDGSPVRAEDVAYAISRSFAIEELPDGPTYQLTYFLDGDEYQGPYQDDTPYRGVEVDGNDITITMSRPFPDMDYYASFPVFTGIPEDRDDGEAYGNHPLATGPYMVGDYRRGRSLTLVRNPQWDPATDPGRIQSVDEWRFEFGQDAAETEATIRANQGEGRTTLTLDNISRPTFEWFRDNAQDRLVVGTAPCTYLWYLDMRKITDIRVRKALGYAYPYQEAWKAAGEINGLTRIPGTAILPPGTAGRLDYTVLDTLGQKADPVTARALLEEAGAMGFEIRYVYAAGDPVSEAVNDAVVAGLEAGGFKVMPLVPDSRIRGARARAARVHVRSSGWCSDWPTGGSWFPAQWDGSLAGPEDGPNLSAFREADADQKQQDILGGKLGDPSQAWGEFDRFIEETYYPAVNLGYAGTAVIRGSDVGGMYSDSVHGMPTFQTMYVTR